MAILLQIHDCYCLSKRVLIQRKATLAIGENILYVLWIINAVGSQDLQRVCRAIVVVRTLIEPRSLYGLPEAF